MSEMSTSSKAMSCLSHGFVFVFVFVFLLFVLLPILSHPADPVVWDSASQDMPMLPAGRWEVGRATQNKALSRSNLVDMI